jgi:hypothetical protein
MSCPQPKETREMPRWLRVCVIAIEIGIGISMAAAFAMNWPFQ